MYSDMKKANLIPIDKDFRFDRDMHGEGLKIDLPQEEEQHIGFNNNGNTRTFHFDPDVLPKLIIHEGQDLAELENTPAIRRIQK